MINIEYAKDAISKLSEYRDQIKNDFATDASGVNFWFRDAITTRISMIEEGIMDSDDSIDGKNVAIYFYNELIDLLSECYDNGLQRKYSTHLTNLIKEIQ